MSDKIYYNKGIQHSIGATQIRTPSPVRFDEDDAESCFNELKDETDNYQESLLESLETHGEALNDMANIIDDLLCDTLHVSIDIPLGCWRDDWLLQKCNGQRLWSGFYQYRSADKRFNKPSSSALLLFEDEESLALFKLAVE